MIKTPLHWAAFDGDVEEMTRLIASGADIDVEDEAGRTPLHVAAYEGKVEAIKVLLAAGSNVGAKEEARSD